MTAAEVRRVPRARRKRTRGVLIAGIAAYLITFVVLLPLFWIAVLSFQSNNSILSDPLSLHGFSWANYINVFTRVPLLTMYGNTILLAVTSVTIGTIISFMSSFALARMVFRWPKFQSGIRLYLLAGLAIPIYILLFPVYRVDIALGVFGTYASLILPYVAVTIPFNTLLLTGFLRDFPSELEEAAIVDGAGLWRLCWSVVLPLMRPVLATVLIFNVIYVFNEYPFVSILINNPSMTTVSLAVSQFQGQYSTDYGAMMAASTIILIPQLVIYALFQKQVVAGMTVGAVKG
ncbi:MAG: transporter permease [Glaciihabitans sp.]|jgi:raffinose/stachyose/melibiose transport system permease protein|nr:transporter permease [Glaciihabitans sp.]